MGDMPGAHLHSWCHTSSTTHSVLSRLYALHSRRGAVHASLFGPAAGTLTVKIGGATATGVSISGTKWLKGKIPANSGGSCSSSVTITYSAGTLTLPKAFCYL